MSSKQKFTKFHLCSPATAVASSKFKNSVKPSIDHSLDLKAGAERMKDFDTSAPVFTTKESLYLY